ncbi:MAG: hypothetical protein FWD71_07715 [Oscillospiraceae bacterium]|nr:hypothetical protein [Oscillospiraceae bacterium]
MGQAIYSEFHSVGVVKGLQFISIEPVAIHVFGKSDNMPKISAVIRKQRCN